MMNAPTGLIAIAETVITGFNHADWQMFKAPLAANVTYEETGTLRRTQGADAYVQLVQGWKQGFPDAQGTIDRVVAKDTMVVQEIIWEGTHTGELITPNGVIPASGNRINVQASVWYFFQGDTI